MTANITELVIRHTKHPGCSYRVQPITIDGDDGGEMTRAAVAIARVKLEREQLEARGSGGDIGGGSFALYLVDEDGDETDADSPEGRAAIAALPVGTVNPRTIAELAAPVWDGDNHTSPDVSPLTSDSTCGHYDAREWLRDCPPAADADAVDIVDEAAAVGVHLDEDEVQAMIDEAAD